MRHHDPMMNPPPHESQPLTHNCAQCGRPIGEGPRVCGACANTNRLLGCDDVRNMAPMDPPPLNIQLSHNLVGKLTNPTAMTKQFIKSVFEHHSRIEIKRVTVQP